MKRSTLKHLINKYIYLLNYFNVKRLALVKAKNVNRISLETTQ